MSADDLRRMVGHRNPKFGVCVMEFDSPGIGHILKAAGAEFVFLDTEHSGFGIDALKRILRYMEAADMPTFVRPPSADYHHMANALDAGAEGLILPMVSSAGEARAIVHNMKYPPMGGRGVALGIAHDRYAPGPAKEKLEAANWRTVCALLIETADGVANVGEIAAVDGVDALWIGHFDLSTSLGIPGQFDHPDFRAAVDRVRQAATDRNLGLGRVVASVDEGVAIRREGFDFICYGVDFALLRTAVRDGIEALRQRCG